MQTAPHFHEKLDLILKALSMSRGRLAAELGVDKSLVGRWVSGVVHPSALNLENLTRLISGRCPVVRLELQDMLAMTMTSLSFGSRRTIPSKRASVP